MSTIGRRARSAATETVTEDGRRRVMPCRKAWRLDAHEQLLMGLLIAPAVAVVGLLLVTPLIWLFWQSITTPAGALTLHNYARIFEQEVYWRTFALTFEIAGSVTALALIMGYPVAYAAARLPSIWAKFVLAMVVIPLWTSVLVRTYAWMVLLQRHGLVNQAILSTGLSDHPLALVNNTTGTIIGTLHVMMPFMVLPLYTAIKKIPDELLIAASTLGSKPASTFLRVLLPLSSPGIVAGSSMVFIVTLGFFITPALLGGGRTIMVSMVIERNVELYEAWGAASAVGFVLLFIVLVLLWIIHRFVKLERLLVVRT